MEGIYLIGGLSLLFILAGMRWERETTRLGALLVAAIVLATLWYVFL